MFESVADRGQVNEPVTEQSGHVIGVLGSSRDQFGHGQIMRLKTASRGPVGSGGAEGHEPFLPAARQDGGLDADAVGVIAERSVEGREFADAPVDELSVVGRSQREEIGFDGMEKLRGRIRVGAEDGR